MEETKNVLPKSHSERSLAVCLRRNKNRNFAPIVLDSICDETTSLIQENILMRSVLGSALGYGKLVEKFNNAIDNGKEKEILALQSDCLNEKRHFQKLFSCLNIRTKKRLARLVATTQNEYAKEIILSAINKNRKLKDIYDETIGSLEFRRQMIGARRS